MKMISGSDWGKGEYTCAVCSEKQVLVDDAQVLIPCKKCGEISFHRAINIKRSDNGLKIKMLEVMTVVETSILLYRGCNLKEFLSVISVQLRILLCDKKNALLPKVVSDLWFHPCGQFTDIRGSKMVLETQLFDMKKERIPFDDWLEQKIFIDSENGIELTIDIIIRSWADTNGGAHIDHELSEKELHAVAFFEKHLISISEYLLTTVLEQDLKDKLQSKILQSGLLRLLPASTVICSPAFQHSGQP